MSSNSALRILQRIVGAICFQNRLSIIGKALLQAHHAKCLTLLGTCSVQIPLQKDLWGFGLELPALLASKSLANNL